MLFNILVFLYLYTHFNHVEWCHLKSPTNAQLLMLIWQYLIYILEWKLLMYSYDIWSFEILYAVFLQFHYVVKSNATFWLHLKTSISFELNSMYSLIFLKAAYASLCMRLVLKHCHRYKAVIVSIVLFPCWCLGYLLCYYIDEEKTLCSLILNMFWRTYFIDDIMCLLPCVCHTLAFFYLFTHACIWQMLLFKAICGIQYIWSIHLLTVPGNHIHDFGVSSTTLHQSYYRNASEIICSSWSKEFLWHLHFWFSSRPLLRSQGHAFLSTKQPVLPDLLFWQPLRLKSSDFSVLLTLLWSLLLKSGSKNQIQTETRHWQHSTAYTNDPDKHTF